MEFIKAFIHLYIFKEVYLNYANEKLVQLYINDLVKS